MDALFETGDFVLHTIRRTFATQLRDQLDHLLHTRLPQTGALWRRKRDQSTDIQQCHGLILQAKAKFVGPERPDWGSRGISSGLWLRNICLRWDLYQVLQNLSNFGSLGENLHLSPLLSEIWNFQLATELLQLKVFACQSWLGWKLPAWLQQDIGQVLWDLKLAESCQYQIGIHYILSAAIKTEAEGPKRNRGRKRRTTLGSLPDLGVGIRMWGCSPLDTVRG